MARHRLIFAGAGGQGVITAAIILAETAIHFEGQNAVQSRSYPDEPRHITSQFKALETFSSKRTNQLFFFQ